MLRISVFQDLFDWKKFVYVMLVETIPLPLSTNKDIEFNLFRVRTEIMKKKKKKLSIFSSAKKRWNIKPVKWLKNVDKVKFTNKSKMENDN